MNTVYLFVGVPGSGKSTFGRDLAKLQGIEMISTDHIRDIHPDWKEERIFPEAYRLIANELLNSKDVIFDATNITPDVRKYNLNGIKKYNVNFRVSVYYFDTPVDVCIERVKKRNLMVGERFLPIDIIEPYSKKCIPPTEEEGFDEIHIIKK